LTATNNNEVQMSMRKFFENLYLNELEIDKFLDATIKLPKLSQDDINHFSRSITSKEIEAVIVSQHRGQFFLKKNKDQYSNFSMK
jgi:type I restriction-modification system DNA methylase subunit